MNYGSLIDQSVRKYNEEKIYTTEVYEIKRDLPIVKVDENVWIASNANVVLGDVKFADVVAKEIAKKYMNEQIDTIITPEVKSVGFAYLLAKNLGIDKIVIARKSVKAYMKDWIKVSVKSITTQKEQDLVLDTEEAKHLGEKKCLIFDDVISTGGTINALFKLIKRVKSLKGIDTQIVGISTIWLEGPWPWKQFFEEIKKGKLKFASVLPIFCKGDVYEEFSNLKEQAKRLYE